jgi:protein-S-isoprenylcysteine O-methyltransferase Ste14
MSILFQFDRLSFILFYTITFFWIGEFWIFPSQYKGKDKHETRSFLKILAMIIVSHLLTITMTIFDWFRINTPNHILMIMSLVTYPLGLGLRYISILYLGKHFTRDVEVSKTQTLISKGPYRWLRHPLYLGLFLLTISVPLFFQNWLMTILSSIAMFFILDHRMNIEEALMEDVIGNTYIEWKKTRYRFIPWIY